MMVLSSAVGPALYGIILDAGLGFATVFQVTIGMLVLVIFQSFRSIPTFSKAKWKYKWNRTREKLKIF